ncbi:MAG TPA: transposase [Kofleriaceae bacterium]|nr:transposase [Kofleriaceae bacterium]
MARARKTHEQQELVFRTHGGRRRGAGRPPRGPRSSERHQERPVHDHRHPVHVTLRVVADVTSLRQRDMYLQLREATIVTARREDFRIVQLSIQRNHLHLLVEADHKEALSRGMQGFAISAAKRINAAITARTGGRRTGKVVADRFHARPLTSPRAVRHALAYVLNNWRRHGEDQAGLPQTWKVDPFSSGPLFFYWKELEDSPVLWPLRETYLPLIVLRPRTWLLAKGWQAHHPLISVREVPGPRA